jgi:uncharacterized protein YjbI with pentapeptide repeats/peptidoglycan hydrolase-like protein with peptidoglycan-binding domain
LSPVSSHVSILRSGPGAWNAWRQKHPSAVPKLVGIALDQSERQLGPSHGGPINLRAALLRGAQLRFATLTGADLAGADLGGADLAHARLDKANLKGADLGESCLDYANLDGANLRRLSLRGASLRFTRLSAADLEAADLSGANLTHARLDEANLKAANLSHARLDYVDFADANLSKVDLRGANLENAKNLTQAQLEEATGDDATLLPPHLQGSVSWSRADTEADLRRAPHIVSAKSVASQHSLRAPVLIAAVVLLAALAFTGWWQYGQPVMPLAKLSEFGASGKLTQLTQSFEDRTSFPSTLASQALKPADAPVLRARIIDRPDFDPPTPRSAPETLVPVPIVLAPLAKRSLLAELTELRPSLAEEKLISVQQAGALGALQAHDGKASEVVPLVAPATTLLHIVSVTAPSEATTLSPPAALASSAVEVPGLHLLELSDPPLRETRPAFIIVSLPFSPTKRDVLTALPPRAEVFLTPVRMHVVPRETRWQNSARPAHRNPLMLSVSLSHQMIDVFRGTTLVMSSKVSSGMPGHETKPGVFSILEKQRYHHSNLYSGAPMPWMQRLTRSGTALHAGMVPGYPASHGCVRLPFSFAPKLFQMTEVGETVLIADERLTPKLIEHPKLFQPGPRPVALAMASSAQIPWRLADGAPEDPADAAILSVVTAKDAEASTADMEPAPVNDSESLAPAPLRILITRRTPRDQMISLQNALCSLGYLKRQNFDGTFGKATVAAIRAFQNANGLAETGAVNSDLLKKVYQAGGKPEPAEGHLFVRQGFARVFDVPIAFRQPSQPLGTHVYTALNFSPGDTKARWIAFSVEGGDAAGMLDRLEIPEDVRRLISEILTPGSSLIVADTSENSAILPKGDDFLVWAKESPAKEPVAKAQSLDVKQASIEPTKPKRAARARPTPREAWPRGARRYTVARPPRFDPPRWFSGW